MERVQKDVEAYQLAAHTLDLLGIHSGTMTKYHQSSTDKETYLENMEVLMYDMLYGDMEVYGGENPFEPTELVMGVTQISVLDAFVKQSASEEETKILYVKGSGFTEWSSIAVDGEEVETIFLNEQLLATTELPKEESYAVTVRQQGSDKIVLSETAPFYVE